MLNSFKDAITLNTPYNTPDLGSCPIDKIRNWAWSGCLRNLADRIGSDTLQKQLVDFGLIDYDPSLEVIGSGTFPDTGEEYLALPAYSKHGTIHRIILRRRRKEMEYHLTSLEPAGDTMEAFIWGKYDVPYTIVCSNLHEMTTFLSQNRDAFNSRFSLMLPRPLCRFTKRGTLSNFTGAKDLIFLEDMEVLAKRCSDNRCWKLKKGVKPSDLRAGNAFTYRCELLEKIPCKS
jgi:hypothetical protein